MNEIVLLALGILYLLSLALAIWRRKDFPLGEAMGVMVVVGLGFTGLVYLIVPASSASTAAVDIEPTELIFVFAYLVLVALLLARKQPLVTAGEQASFLKKSLYTLIYKLLLFVGIPLVCLRLLWPVGWSELGFAPGNLAGQLLSAGLLILLLGGFNLLTGGGAAPIRARQFSSKQVVIGLGIAFAWNILETGLVEEFFFRGFVQSRLVGYLGAPVAGIALTSLLFGLAHAPGIYLRGGEKTGPLGEHPTLLNSVLYTILALSPTGWFTGLLFWRTQSLLAPILVHAGIDAVSSAVEFIRGLKLPK